MNEKQRIICWFSCGAASSMAAKLTVEKYSHSHEVVVVCCDTRPSEDADNYRFSAEAERFIGAPIQFIRNAEFETVDDVFEKARYMSGVSGARCTVALKKKPRFVFAKPDDIHVFGFTAEEKRRIKDFTDRNPELHLLWILSESGYTKQKCLDAIKAAGIQLPRMYRLGFDNNNCPGCVKSSSPWYWDMIRKHFPEIFKRRCEQSRKLGVRLVEIRHHQRIFLDELPPGPFKRRGQKENMSCGPECGVALTPPQPIQPKGPSSTTPATKEDHP
jgi:hypothetical protein